MMAALLSLMPTAASAYALAATSSSTRHARNICTCTRTWGGIACEEARPNAPVWRHVRGATTAVAVCAAGLVGGSSLSAVLSRVGIGASPAYAATEAVAEAPSRMLSGARQKKLRLALKSKLNKVPVFMVTNEGGSPFLNRLASGDQSALMFLFPDEAERMLEGVLKAPNGASSGAKVYPTTLDRAFKLARMEPIQSGLRDQMTNRELTMVWQFMPHAAEQRAAQMLMVKSAKVGPPAVPAYIVDGLVMTKRGKEIRPIFFSKKDCDTAVAAIDTEGQSAKVQVVDALGLLLQISQDIEAGNPDAEEVLAIELVPPSESLTFRERLNLDKPHRPPKIVKPTPQYYY